MDHTHRVNTQPKLPHTTVPNQQNSTTDLFYYKNVENACSKLLVASHTSSIKLAKHQLAHINSLSTRVTKLPQIASIDTNVYRTQIQLPQKTEQPVPKPEKGSPSYYWGAATDHRSTDRPAELQHSCCTLMFNWVKLLKC